jgi:hypothetical protein
MRRGMGRTVGDPRTGCPLWTARRDRLRWPPSLDPDPGGETVEQQAFDLIWLTLFILGALSLPIVGGLIAVFRE